MLEPIRAWLNGNRDYYTGVAIYSQAGTNEELLQVLKKGPNDFRTKRLQDELLTLCNQLKIQQHGIANPVRRKDKTNAIKSAKGPDQQPIALRPHNPTLYDACKLEADLQYKKVMNTRARLFGLATHSDYVDVNKEDKVFDRVKLALEVVHEYNLVSQLYDRAAYVKIHGRLPNDQDDNEENEYDHLQDHLVKLRLDNARKAYNKLKAKEQTAERISLLQKHEENIKKLEAKWDSLKPQ